MNDTPSQPMKRKLLGLLAILPWLPACSAAQTKDTADLAYKFRGIRGVVVRTDAIGEKRRVTIVSDTNRQIEAPSLLSPKNNSILSFSGGALPVPKSVHVTWREGDAKYDSPLSPDGTRRLGPNRWLGGTIVGDYTIEVASRIPDAVLDSIRNEGGALRLKFRLKDDGVLLGWDIERPGGGISRYTMVGGDFREAYIFNGKVVEPGWYIDKDGQKIETDF
jgi:hypothetical protein